MTLQSVVWGIALVGMGLVALGFIHVIIQAGKPADEDATRKSVRTAHRLQAGLFWVLLLGFVFGSWATLRHFPIPPQHDALDARQVVDVVGRMWSWQLTPATVQAGSTVEFRVSSADVNHGFALYGPDGLIVAQTQAMPGFTNKLLHTFARTGTYTVQCLEYCGLGHAPMKTTLEVVAAGGELSMATLTLYPDQERLAGGERFTFNLYMISAMALFVLMMLIGLSMRMAQAKWLGVSPDLFYKFLSMHGAGMVGTMSLATTAVMWFFLRKYVRLHLWAFVANYVLFLLGALCIIIRFSWVATGRCGPSCTRCRCVAWACGRRMPRPYSCSVTC